VRQHAPALRLRCRPDARGAAARAGVRPRARGAARVGAPRAAAPVGAPPRRGGRRASRAVRRRGGGGRARGRRVRRGPDRGQRAPPAVVAARADAVRGSRTRARPRAGADPVRGGAMIALLGTLVVLALPVAGLVVLLKMLDFLQRRRAATVARPSEVTDAIHREVGPIVAPTVA